MIYQNMNWVLVHNLVELVYGRDPVDLWVVAMETNMQYEGLGKTYLWNNMVDI